MSTFPMLLIASSFQLKAGKLQWTWHDEGRVTITIKYKGDAWCKLFVCVSSLAQHRGSMMDVFALFLAAHYCCFFVSKKPQTWWVTALVWKPFSHKYFVMPKIAGFHTLWKTAALSLYTSVLYITPRHLFTFTESFTRTFSFGSRV